MIRLFFVLMICSIQFHSGLGVPYLLVSTKQDVRIVDAAAPDDDPPFPLISENVKAESNLYMDYHYRKQLVCWSDSSEQTVQCVQRNNSLQPVVFVSDLTQQPEGVAVDWLADTLYWADSKAERLEVVSLQQPHHRRVLYWRHLASINAITLLPSQGLLFWSTWGDSPKLEVASMGGSDTDTLSRRTLVSTGLRWPNGIAINQEAGLLYWADAQKDKPFIEAVNFAGTFRRKILTEGLQHPFALSYYSNALYWTDWNTQSIHTCSIAKQGSCSVQRQISRSNSTTYVRVYSPDLQPPQPSPCHPSPCSSMCLLAPTLSHRHFIFNTSSAAESSSSPAFTYQCSCPTGITLQDDGHTCRDGPAKFLLLARTGGLFRVSLDTPDYTVLPLESDPPDNETNHDATDVDYDPVNDEIYWVDVERKAVRASKEYRGGKIVTRTVLDQLEGNGGFALDIKGRNLYWTDERRHCIHAAAMDGSARMVIVWTQLDHPRAITVHTTLSLLFWTDWGDEPKIERAQVDGSQRTAIVNTSLVWPNGIALDEREGKIYWVDGSRKKIERARLDGSGREVLVGEGLHHLSGLSLLHSTLYWLDTNERSVTAANTDAASGVRSRVDVLRNVPFIHCIKAVDRPGPFPVYGAASSPSAQLKLSPCAVNKANCSHICFRGPRDDSYTCSCPADLELSYDNHTCVGSAGFLLYGGGREGVHRLSLSPPYHSQPLPLAPIKGITSIAYSAASSSVYISDSVSKSIWRTSLSSSSSSDAVVRHGLELPHSIALDHVNANLYWLDMEINRLEVCRLDGSARRVLVWQSIDKPYSIAVEPLTRFLYWSELGSESGTIKRAWLDGSHSSQLVSGIGHHIALTVQSPGHLTGHARLYWTDPGHSRIETCLGDGSNRKVLVPKLTGCVGVGVWQDRVYWAQQNTHSNSYSLHSADARTGAEAAVLKNDLNQTSLVFTIAQHSQGSVTSSPNPCSPNNGGCSHLCLPPPQSSSSASSSSPSSLACACPTHYTLATDNKSCLPPTSFLIYGQKWSISRLVDGSTRGGGEEQDCPTVVLAIKGARNVADVAFDPTTHTVYWLDTKNKKVWATQERAAKKQVVVDNPGDSVHPHSLAVDYVSGLVFVSCAKHNTINVTRQTVAQHRPLLYTNLGVVVGLPSDSPRALTVHSALRLLFFINMASPSARLEVCRLDGSRRRVLIDSDLTEPSALTVDSRVGWKNGDEPRLYWFDVRPSRIESCHLDGSDRRVVVSEHLERVLSLTVLQEWLYWVDAGTNRLERVTTQQPADTRTVVLDRLSDLAAIVAVDVAQASESQPCSSASENECSQLCLMSGNQTRVGLGAPDHPIVYAGGGGSRHPWYGGPYGTSATANNNYAPTPRRQQYKSDVQLPTGHAYNSNDAYHGTRRGNSNVHNRPSNIVVGPNNIYSSSVNSGNVYGGYSSIGYEHSNPLGSRRYDSSKALDYSRSVAGYGSSVGGVPYGVCGCVYGEVLLPNGWECGLCLSHHFICRRSPLLCVPQHFRCDGVEHCDDGSDERNCRQQTPPCTGEGCESSSYQGQGTFPSSAPQGSSKTAYIVGVSVCVLVLLCLAALLVYYRRRPPLEDALVLAATSAGLKSQQQHQLLQRSGPKASYRSAPAGSTSSCQQRLLPDSSCSVTCLNSSSCAASGCTGLTHLNGGVIGAGGEMFSLGPTSGAHASSSSSSTTHYPKETVNPPPTPTTRQPSSAAVCYNTCYHPLHPSSSSNLSSAPAVNGYSRHPHHLQYYPRRGGVGSSLGTSAQFIPPPKPDHSYRHYKTRNRPPPPTPCSTDICDDSDINSTARVTSTPSYSSDTNTNDHHHHPSYHHHPNSPNTQYCSFSSLPRTDYYCDDSDPEPPPPTPQLAGDALLYGGGTMAEENGVLLASSPLPPAAAATTRTDRYYCPPPPSPVASD